MNISSYAAQGLSSIQSAINIAMLQKAMHMDSATVGTLMQDMVNVNKSIMENSVTPHVGGNVDISI
ncbi:MAG: putative motility protein [Thermotaleaceae bacterium]